jgi:toxin ParE1/3/4
MRRFHISDEAQEDLNEIWLYISDDSPNAADRVIADIVKTFPLLAEFPGIGRPRDELASGLRSYTIGIHLVFYRPMEDGVEVARVLHGAMRLERFFRS